MKLLVPLILLFRLSNSWANQCSPSGLDCSAYLCVEDTLKCGYKGFPLRFGYRFCNNFLELKVKSSRLNTWLNNTRHCLQDKMVSNSLYSCSNIQAGSIRDHVTCYKENGFCQLPTNEKNLIKKEIIKEFFTAPLYVTKNIRNFLINGCR